MSWLKFGAVVLMAWPAAAFAFDWTPDTTRILSDPAFLPARGQLASTTTMEYRDGDQDLTRNGVPSGSTSGNGYGITETLTYGATDRLAVRLSMDHWNSEFSETTASGRVLTYHHNGFDNPTLSLVYRALEQKTSPVSVDVGGSYSPDLFTSRSATTTQDGTVASGGQSAGGFVALNREMKSMTIRAVAGVSYFGDRRGTDPSDNSTDSYGSNWGYHFGVNTQTRFSERVSVDFRAGYAGRTDMYSYNRQQNGAHNNSYGGEIQTSIGANYHLYVNRIVVGLEYDRNYLADHTMSYPSGVTWVAKDGVENRYVAHLRFLFF